MKTQRNNYRTRFEIVNIFLNKLKRKRKLGMYKTMLNQQSNLSPNGFKEYFNILKNNKLIKQIKNKQGKRKKIFITELGEDYLKKSNLLCLKIEKLNKQYKINLRDINYIH